METVEKEMPVGKGVDERKATPSEQGKKPWSRPTFRRLEDGIVVVESGPKPANWVLVETISYTKIS